MKSIGRLMLVASLGLAVAGCVTAPPVVAAAGACSELIPEDWEKGVEGAEVPAEAPPEPQGWEAKYHWAVEEVKKWAGFGNEESARREMANGRTKDTIGITRRCEARDRKALSNSRPKFLGVF